MVSYDIDTVNASLSSDFLQVLQGMITVSVSFVMMLTIQPLLVLIFAVTVPLTALYTRWITGKTRPYYRRRSAKLGELNGFMEEMMGGQKTTKAYGREREVIRQFDAINEEGQGLRPANTTAPSSAPRSTSSTTFPGADQRVRLPALPGGRRGPGQTSPASYSIRASFPAPSTRPPTYWARCRAPSRRPSVFRLIDQPPEPPDAPDARTLTGIRGT